MRHEHARFAKTEGVDNKLCVPAFSIETVEKGAQCFPDWNSRERYDDYYYYHYYYYDC